jgi:hypothetical protein
MAFLTVEEMLRRKQRIAGSGMMRVEWCFIFLRVFSG